MRGPRLRRPSPALIISGIALFVSLGGTGYAATQLSATATTAASGSGHKRPPKPVTVKQVNKLIAAYLAAHHGLRGPAGATGSTGSTGATGPGGGVGQTGPQGPGAQRIVFGQRGVVPFETIATIGPWTVAMECEPGVARIRFTGPGSFDYTASRGVPATETAKTEENNGPIESGVTIAIGNDVQMDLHGVLIDEPSIEQLNLEVSDFKGLISSCTVVGDAIPVS